MDVSKIEQDISDANTCGSKYFRIVRSGNGTKPKSACPHVPIMHPLHSLGTSVITQLGRSGCPYRNVLRQSGKS